MAFRIDSVTIDGFNEGSGDANPYTDDNTHLRFSIPTDHWLALALLEFRRNLIAEELRAMAPEIESKSDGRIL